MRKATPWLLEQINRMYVDIDLKEAYILSKKELMGVVEGFVNYVWEQDKVDGVVCDEYVDEYLKRVYEGFK